MKPAESMPQNEWRPPSCAECGSLRLRAFAVYCGTGMLHPDGTEAIHWEEGIHCLDCGTTEPW